MEDEIGWGDCVIATRSDDKICPRHCRDSGDVINRSHQSPEQSGFIRQDMC